jgi:hypothetical protein
VGDEASAIHGGAGVTVQFALSTDHLPIVTADSRLIGRSLIDPLGCEGFEGAA